MITKRYFDLTAEKSLEKKTQAYPAPDVFDSFPMWKGKIHLENLVCTPAFDTFLNHLFRTNTCVKRASALNKFNISHIHGFLQRISSVQKVPDQLLCDGKVCWELGASFD